MRAFAFKWLLPFVLLLPLAAQAGLQAGFIENQGQFAEGALYVYLGPEFNVAFTAGGLIIQIPNRTPSPPTDPALQASVPASLPTTGEVVRLLFRDACPAPQILPSMASPARLNFFLGNDPQRWRTDVPAFGELTYAGLWPGTDLKLRAAESGLELTLEGASPRAFSASIFDIAGADGIEETRTGLALETASGQIDVMWAAADRGQAVLSRSHRRHVPASRALAPQDAGEGMRWSTFLGASGLESAEVVTVDASGNTVLGGSVQDGFPTTPGVWDNSFNGTWDISVTKISKDGTTLLWSTYVGGSGSDTPFGIALDASQNVIIAGRTDGSNFPTTGGAYDRTYNGGTHDAVIFKLSNDGHSLLWSTFFGGSARDEFHTVALDAAGNPTVMGTTWSSNLPTTPGAFRPTSSGGIEMCATKFNSSGSALLASTYVGGSSDDYSYSVIVGSDGVPIFCGRTGSADFPITAGAYQHDYAGGEGDGCVFSLDASLSQMLWSTFLGGDGLDAVTAVDFNVGGTLSAGGSTRSADFPVTEGAYDTSFNGTRDGFIALLSSAGDSLLGSTYLGGNNDEYDAVYNLVVDHQGSVLATGITDAEDFPTTPGAFDPDPNGLLDGFVAKLTSSCESLVWSTYLGGAEDDYPLCIATDDSGAAVISGYTWSAGFPVTSGSWDTSFGGGEDIFVTWFDIPCQLWVVTPHGGETFQEADSVVIRWHDPLACAGPTVRIELLQNDQVCLVLASAAENDEEFTWSAAICAGTTSEYRIRVTGTGTGIGDDSDAPFTVRPFFRILSVSDVGNDQGRQVRLRWQRCLDDGPGGLNITSYGIYRRQDEFLMGSQDAVHEVAGVVSASPCLYFLDGWDYLGAVPARGDAVYQFIAPTLCDSTAIAGICWSVYFVSAMTPDPLVYMDCQPDSGYSVDNLPPGVPGNLRFSAPTVLAWDDPAETDFDFCSVYGSEVAHIDSTATLIVQTTETTCDISGNASSYFHVTVTDVAGNESEAATIENAAAGIDGVRVVPADFALRSAVRNPAGYRVTLWFDLACRGEVRLQVYDVGGRLVATLLDRMMPAGTHGVSWDGLDSRGRRVPAGVYLCRMDAAGYTATSKIVIAR